MEGVQCADIEVAQVVDEAAIIGAEVVAQSRSGRAVLLEQGGVDLVERTDFGCDVSLQDRGYQGATGYSLSLINRLFSFLVGVNLYRMYLAMSRITGSISNLLYFEISECGHLSWL